MSELISTPPVAETGGGSAPWSRVRPLEAEGAESAASRARRLIEAHRTGDGDAFPTIVHDHYAALYGHAMRSLGQPQAAEDAVQEALVRAYRALPRFNGDYHLGAWLHRILANVCTDEGIRRRKADVAAQRWSALRTTDAGFDEQVTGTIADVEIVSDAVSRLPDNYREVLFLRDVLDLEYADVATRTGISEQNARARVHRARAALREMVSASALTGAGAVALFRRSFRHVFARAQQVAPNVSSMSPEVVTAPGRVGVAATSLLAAAAVSVAVAVPALTHTVSSEVPAPVRVQATAGPLKAAPGALSTVAPASIPSGASASIAPTTVAPASVTSTTSAQSTSTSTSTTSSTVGAATATTLPPQPAQAMPSGSLSGPSLHVVAPGYVRNISGPMTITIGGMAIQGAFDGDLQLSSGSTAYGPCDGTLSALVTWPLAGGGTESVSFAAIATGQAAGADGVAYTISGNGDGSTASSAGFEGDVEIRASLSLSGDESSAVFSGMMAPGRTGGPSTCSGV